MKFISRKGIPVVAYESLGKQVASPCHLFIRYAPDENELTFRLQFEFEGDQSYGLLYHADNLNPQTALRHPSMRLPPNAPTHLARNASHSADLRDLFLSLKQTCPIQCKPNQEILAPKSDPNQAYRAFVELAKAKAIHILFDYKWIPSDVSLSLILDGLVGLHGSSLDDPRARFVDWTALACEDAVPRQANGDQPPTYTAVASRKDPAASVAQPVAAFRDPSKQKPAEARRRRKTPYPPPASPDEKRTLPAASESASLDSQSETSSTPQATLLEALANANVKNFPDLLAHLRTLGEDMLEHAGYLRSEADNEFKDDIHNYRMILEDERDNTIDSAKAALDDLYNSFGDRKAQAIHDGEDDIALFQAGLVDVLESSIKKNEAKIEQHAAKVLEDVCKKIVERSGLAGLRSEEEREELASLDEREKILEEEYRERKEMLKKERLDMERYWRDKRALHDKRAGVLKRKHEEMVSQVPLPDEDGIGAS
ncbi:hypothetical protein DPSP01_014467 [Paraphaeosphaeria sporulosa]